MEIFILAGCGLRPSDERIVGGWPVRAHSYPWLAAIVQANDSARLVCGSSLISSEFALTGAHCVRDRAGRDTRPDALLVLLGAHNLSEQVGVQRMQIRSITVYPLFAYSKDTLAPSFDLALIRFRRPAVLNERVRPLCMHSLPFQRELPALLELLRTYPTLPAAAGQQTHLPRTSEGEPPAGDQPAPEPAPEPLPGGLEVAERWADEFLRQEPWPPGWPMMGAEGDQRRVRKPLLVAGWGSTSPEGDVRQLSQVPRHVGIQEMSSQMCTGSYGADVFDVQRSLCAARDGACSACSSGTCRRWL